MALLFPGMVLNLANLDSNGVDHTGIWLYLILKVSDTSLTLLRFDCNPPEIVIEKLDDVQQDLLNPKDKNVIIWQCFS
jgi:hypothetical protein